MPSNTLNNRIAILVVDDDPDVLKFIDHSLPEEEYTLFFAENGRVALDMFKDHHFDIVISDVTMPEVDGINLCRAIRNQSQGNYSYILLISSHNDDEAIGAGIRAGADDYLTKPFTSIELLVKLHIANRTLSLHRELEEAQQQLAEQTMQDPLTQTYSRRHFSKLLRIELQRSARYQRPMSVLLCNIDNMSGLNAQYGNTAGDQLLQQVAHCLLGSIRSLDFIGRLGGDEFAILLPETETANAMQAADRFRRTIDATAFKIEKHQVNTSLRIGVAGLNEVNADKHTPDSILSYAKYFVDQSRSVGGNTTAGIDISSE